MSALNPISFDLLEVILSFVCTKDVKNFARTCKENYYAVEECIKVYRIYDCEICVCICCKKLTVDPVVFTVKMDMDTEKNYLLCSEKCKYHLIYRFPRCYFCLNTMGNRRIMETLICSEICEENLNSGQRREDFI
jgi:hypothetical protein